MGRSTVRIVFASLVEAQLAVDGQADIGSVDVFLAVVLPPANGAQAHRARSFESLRSAAGAAIQSCDGFHGSMDEKRRSFDYRKAALRL